MGSVNTAEAAKKLGLSVRRVQTMIKTGLLAATRFGRDWAIDEAALAAFAKKERRPGRPRKSDS